MSLTTFETQPHFKGETYWESNVKMSLWQTTLSFKVVIFILCHVQFHRILIENPTGETNAFSSLTIHGLKGQSIATVGIEMVYSTILNVVTTDLLKKKSLCTLVFALVPSTVLYIYIRHKCSFISWGQTWLVSRDLTYNLLVSSCSSYRADWRVCFYDEIYFTK